MGTAREKPLDPDRVVGWLTRAFGRKGPGIIAGVGEDDCGVIRVGPAIVVVSADYLNATPIAEQLGLGTERTLGRIAVAATLADLLGSGAVPRALIVGITAPHGYPERLFRDLMLGVRFEARRWRVSVVGGDTKLGAARAVLTCGIGTVESPRELFLTRRARPGDAILVSGFLGTCAAATLLASQIKQIKREPKVPSWVRSAITVPRLPISQSRALARLRIVNGGIDISDGLAHDVRRLCSASRVGAVIRTDFIPVRAVVRNVARTIGVAPWAFSFASGGDFQFLVTVPQRDFESALRLGFKMIGRVTQNRRVLLQDSRGHTTPLPDVGHRDRLGQQFSDEIHRIVAEVSRVQ